MRSSRLPHPEDGVVLAGLKATPSGWPPVSLDPDCGRHREAARGKLRLQESQISGLYGFRGLPLLFCHECSYCPAMTTPSSVSAEPITDPTTTTPATATSTGTGTDELVAEDLIEEVSIDGMCGVY